MLEWLNENPLVVLAFLVVVIFVLMFVFVKVKKKKPKKEPEQKTDKKETETKDTGDAEEKEPTEKIRVKKSKIRPQIERLYKRQVEIAESEKKPEDNPDELDGKQAQFVKRDGKVSRFVGFEEIARKEEEMIAAEQERLANPQDDCAICKPQKKHFDRTRRLSRMIRQDSFDDMLEEHISEHYLNIDETRHLRISDDFSEKLFDRAMKTLSNSDVKVLVDEEDSEEKPLEKMRGDKEYMKQWLADRKRENMAAFIASKEVSSPDDIDEETAERLKNEIDLSPKNIVVVDSILNRKGKRKK